MRPPDVVVRAVEDALGCSMKSTVAVGGGCISNASRIETDEGPYFLKWAAGSAGETFVAEGKGLAALRSHAERLIVPEPISMCNADATGPGHLLMDWIEEDAKTDSFWKALGRGLAAMHRQRGRDDYGFETDNYIGRLPQRNLIHADWPEFFAEERLLVQAGMARRSGAWSSDWDAGLNGLLRSLDSILPAKPESSLVHGDLWAGNVLAAKGNRAAVVDPAVYWGHREVDLAMSQLFGGFPASFYASYDAEWAVEGGYEDRRDVYNLYHLINHLNHFGSSYAGQVAGILRRFA